MSPIYIYIHMSMHKLLDAMICGMKYRHEMMDIHKGRERNVRKVNLVVVLVDELIYLLFIEI
jgi:hypothetical protein